MSDADIRSLIDRAFKESKVMLRTHLKDDILAFISTAQAIDAKGYQLEWHKYRGIVSITKKTTNTDASITNPTKEMKHYGGNPTTNAKAV